MVGAETVMVSEPVLKVLPNANGPLPVAATAEAEEDATAASPEDPPVLLALLVLAAELEVFELLHPLTRPATASAARPPPIPYAVFLPMPVLWSDCRDTMVYPVLLL